MEKRHRNSVTGCLAFTAALLAVVMLCCSVGRYHVSFPDILHALANYLFGADFEVGPKEYSSVVMLRLPRVLMAVIVGASLSVSGTVYQSIFNNKLISPDLLGVSMGCCVGAAFAILLGASGAAIIAGSFGAGILAVLLALLLPVLMRNTSNLSLVLSGIIVSAVFNSILGFIKYAVDSLEKLESITFWIMGSLSAVTMRQLKIVFPLFVAALTMLLLLRFQINIISLGESEATLLGIRYRLTRITVIICATVLTACATAICGTVSWVGLIIPHISRLLTGADNRELIPFSAMLGALVLPIIDTLCRTLTVNEIPISIISGAFGAMVFFMILVKKGRYIE